jgi:putative acetyltransferase
MIDVRPERPGDEGAIRSLNLAAFEGPEEAELVDRLRSGCSDYMSFVAVDGSSIVGHILFTPVTLSGADPGGMGLGPMAVSPSRQREGIGARMIHYAVDQLRRSGCPFVVVLGHPDYYPRFGFERASNRGVRSQWEGIPDEAWMVLVLRDGALPEGGGVLRYRPEFEE